MTEKNDLLSTIDVSYNSEQNILYITRTGYTPVNLVIENWEHLIKNNLIPKDCKRFLSIHHDIITPDPSKAYKALDEFYAQHPEVFEGAKTAVLTTTPKQTAMTELILRKISNIQVKTFSTEAAAIDWLMY